MRQSTNKKGGIAVSVIIFMSALMAMIGGLISHQMDLLIAYEAVDTKAQIRAENRAMSNVVKEAYLAKSAMAHEVSQLSIGEEISNRLNVIVGGGDQSIDFDIDVLDDYDSYPVVRPQFPESTDVGNSHGQLEYINRWYGSRVGGLSNNSYVVFSGGVAFDITRHNGNAAEDRTEEYDVWSLGIPLSNYELICYGMPASGTVPATAPANTNLLNTIASLPTTSRPLILTEKNPAVDTTAFPQLAETHAGGEVLPYYYRELGLLAWDAWEFIWNPDYQHSIIDRGGDPFTWDFTLPEDENPVIPGVSVADVGGFQELTIDLNQLSTPNEVLSIIDSLGGNTVRFIGDRASVSDTTVFVIRNESVPLSRTNVEFDNSTTHAGIYYLTGCLLEGTGETVTGAIWLDTNSLATGTMTVFGSFAFYHENADAIFNNFNLNLSTDNATRYRMMPFVPRPKIATIQ